MTHTLPQPGTGAPGRRGSPRRPTLRHRLEFLGYRLLVGALRRAPERFALRLGEGLGWVAGVVLGIRRRVVLGHLRTAFPGRDEGWHRRVAAASFRHLGREAVATFRLGRMGIDEVRERTRVEGLEELRSALQQGRGAIVVAGHMGNWEIGGAALAARGIPMEVLAQRQRNPLFDAEVVRNRERLGMVVIERGEAPRRALRALRSGRVLGVVGDQNARRDGVFVNFFGRPASTARGTAVFALRTGCPIFVGGVRREEGFPQRYRVRLQAVPFTPTGDAEEDVLHLTQVHTRYLQEMVEEAPEQYFWQHRRWKTRPSPERTKEG